jgi:uroporphyrinogen-III synthase
VNGARVGITAARRAAEQAALVTALGGVPVIGPSLRSDAPEPDAVLGPSVDAILAGPVDVIVFLTGVGAGLIFDYARRHGHEDAFRERLAAATVVVRGTKPRRALRAVGVEVDVVAHPAVVTRVRDLLLDGDVAGRWFFVQGFAGDPVELTAPLRDAGAQVLTLSPYAASLPDDPEPAAELARAATRGELGALTFTSALAARQFVGIAEDAGVDTADLDACPALIVAVGPVTRAALEGDGLRVDVEPQTPRMAPCTRPSRPHCPWARRQPRGDPLHCAAGPGLRSVWPGHRAMVGYARASVRAPRRRHASAARSCRRRRSTGRTSRRSGGSCRSAARSVPAASRGCPGASRRRSPRP